MRRSAVAFLLLVACESGAEVEAGVFFPTWSAEGAVPAGIVQGVLDGTDGCVYISANGQRTLPVWEEGLGFADETLLGSDGEPIAEVGEVVHGGGGWYGGADGRAHIEDLAGERIPDGCVIDEGPDRFAVIYDVEAGPFTGWSSPTEAVGSAPQRQHAPPLMLSEEPLVSAGLQPVLHRS